MIDINQIINQEIMRERLLARNELANEILHIIGCPKNYTEYIDRVEKAQERLFEVREDYEKI